MDGPCVIVVTEDNGEGEIACITGVIGSPPFETEAAAMAWLDEHQPAPRPGITWRIEPLIRQAEVCFRAYA